MDSDTSVADTCFMCRSIYLCLCVYVDVDTKIICSKKMNKKKFSFQQSNEKFSNRSNYYYYHIKYCTFGKLSIDYRW